MNYRTYQERFYSEAWTEAFETLFPNHSSKHTVEEIVLAKPLQEKLFKEKLDEYERKRSC